MVFPWQLYVSQHLPLNLLSALRFCQEVNVIVLLFGLFIRMFLSLFCASLLFAAGSNASPCIPKTGNWTSSISTTGSKLALHRDGHGSAAGLSLVSTSGGSGSNNTAASSSGTSGTSITSGHLTSASGSCPTGFLNVVFNTNAGQAAGFPSTTWNTLTSYGISNWSASTLAVQKDPFPMY